MKIVKRIKINLTWIKIERINIYILCFTYNIIILIFLMLK